MFRVLIQGPEAKHVTHILPKPGLVELGELLALLKILMECHAKPANIFPDSQYAVQAICTLSFSQIKEQINFFICDHVVHTGHVSPQSPPLVYFSSSGHTQTSWPEVMIKLTP